MKNAAQIEAENVIAGLAVRLVAARARAATARREVQEASDALVEATAEWRAMPEAHGNVSILVLDGKFLVHLQPGDPKPGQRSSVSIRVHPIDVVG